MSVGERVKARRKELKLSVDEVAKRMGKNRATIYRYESNEIENMSLDIITSLAKVLKVDPSYLMGWKENKEDLNANSEYYYFPAPISAGLPNTVDGVTNAEKIAIPDSVMGKHAGEKDIYITKINGDSMNNVMSDGSLIAIKPVELHELQDGDIVVYEYNNECAVKRYYKRGNKVIFKPDSNDVVFTDKEIDINNDLNLIIHGKVVLYIVELD